MNYPTRNEFQNQPELHTHTLAHSLMYVDVCPLEFIARYA